MAKDDSINPALNLQMAREAAERVGQHHDPLTRSLQQGWEHGWYHGTVGDIGQFDPATRGEATGAASAKKGYFFARDPSTPPAHMLAHDPESVALLQKLGKPIPPNPTMQGHGAHTASSYAGTGGSREYKEAMRMAHAAEKVGNWDAYEKFMMKAEDAVTNEMNYRQGLVAKHGDARDEMLEKINNAWYGAQNADKFKNMSQADYEAHDKLHKELMPYGWYTSYEKPHFENLIHQINSVTGEKHAKQAIDAIKKYQAVQAERKASEVESGANVMPVALRYKNPMYHDFQGNTYRDETYSDLMDKAMRGGHDALILKNTFDPGGSMGQPKMVDVGIVFHPSQIRGKFAAFDPTRTKESDLLAARGGLIHAAQGGNVEEPKNTVKAYKLFRAHPKHPGKLFPLFVDSNTPVEMGQWVNAKEGEMANGKVKSKIGALAYRPGWHAGDLPIATHIGEKSDPSLTAPDLRPANHVWAEVEMPNDVDWQSEANRRGTNAQGRVIPVKAHITDQIPVGGHYRYKTNPNMTGNWLIGGSMKVNRVLSDAEVAKINKAAGLADLPRSKPFNKKQFGFAGGGTVAPQEWMAEEHVNHFQNGGSKGYRVHTPTKPHPEVGTRFVATPQGNLAPRVPFDVEAHENQGAFTGIPYDATTRDMLVTNVSGHQLDKPVLTEGGNDYSLDKRHMAQRIGGASNFGIASRVQNRIDKASQEDLERGGTGRVFLLPTTMGEHGENFSTMPMDVALQLLRQRGLKKSEIEDLNQDIRSRHELVEEPRTKKKIRTYPYANFLGFNHPEVEEQLRSGGYGLDSTAGDLRKLIMSRLGDVKRQKLLDYNLADLKAAILDPELSKLDKGFMGHTVVEAAPGAPLRLSRHGSYDTDYEGVNKGTIGSMPLEMMMPDAYSNSMGYVKNLKANIQNPKTPAQIRAQAIGRLEKAKEKFSQPINSRVVTNVGNFRRGMTEDKFNPNDLESILNYFAQVHGTKLNPGGYADGGKVEPTIDEMQAALAMKKPVHLAIGGQGPKNWMKGVEGVINPLKGHESPRYTHINDEGQAVGENYGRPMTEQELQTLSADPMYARNKVLNKWIESNLGNYIRKQMATHDDPVRKLAEEGILHVDPNQIGINRYKADLHRANWDAPKLGKSEHAQAWEDATDVAMKPNYVSHLEGSRREPWMDKVDPSTKVFAPTGSMDANALGFDHLIDILKQDMAEGRMRPEQLSKVSMEQAVRRAHEYNEERKRKMAETALKATEGMPVHKDYGNGFRWLELALDKNLPEGWSQHPSGTYTDPQGVNHVQHPNYSKLEEALKYEGDTMGHCVGGYCPDVASGNTRIFSLRDKKNEPHVTIEVKPKGAVFSDVAKYIGKEEADRLLDQGVTLSEMIKNIPNFQYPQRINQIKGKGNAKPVAKYIPYAQDFVKSGNWSDVNDAQNANLRHAKDVFNENEHKQLIESGNTIPQHGYLSGEEIQQLHNAINPAGKRLKYNASGNIVGHEGEYKQGGIIRKATGGSMPSLSQMQAELMMKQPTSLSNITNVGAEEAPNLPTKDFILPHGQHPGQLPVGGVDMQPAVPGQQLMPQQPGQQPQQGGQPPQGGPAPQGGPQGAPQPSNILQMTPQGRALGAMQPQQPAAMARGGSVPSKYEVKPYHDDEGKRVGWSVHEGDYIHDVYPTKAYATNVMKQWIEHDKKKNEPQQAKKGGTIKPVGHGITKEKVTISPNLDAMQYELMSVKHFKKAK